MTVIFLGLLLCMALVLWLDATRYLIPNWLNGLLIALYPAMIMLSPAPVDWVSGVIGLCVMFAIGYALFALHLMGGGDVKLLAACALWVGFSGLLLEFGLWVAVFGGVLSVALILLRRLLQGIVLTRYPDRTLPRILQVGAPAPYGLAIVAAFVRLLVQGKLPGVAM